MVAFGEVTCLLYPRHVLPQVFAFAHAVLDKTSESARSACGRCNGRTRS